MTYKTEQEQFWSGTFGDEYIGRNADDFLVDCNASLFAKVFAQTGSVDSVIEFGANRGLNLQAIKRLLSKTDVSAVEINQSACKLLEQWGACTEIFNQSALTFESAKQYDLSFVKGVLIHINPDFLHQMYGILYNSSKRWIFISEYYNTAPVEVNYRGHEGRLFKRDFAGELMDRYPTLKLVDYGFVWGRDTHFPQDDMTWFLLEKS